MDSEIKIRIGIAEDQVIFREGLIRMLNNNPHFEVVCEADNGQHLIDQIRDKKPQVCLVDYRMPGLNGIETTKSLKLQYPKIKVILLSMYDDSEFVESAIENGANGYLSKDDEPEEIEKAIYSAYETGYYINDRTSKMLIARMVEQGKIHPRFSDEQQLFSDFELKIIQLITEERTTAEIAKELERSVRTIESTRSAMMNRIGAKNVIGLVMYAVKNKLLAI